MRTARVILLTLVLLMMIGTVSAATAATFTGYYNFSQTLSSGQSITIPSGAVRVEGSVAGEVPEYGVTVDFENKSSFPQSANLLAAWDFNHVDGNLVTSAWGGPAGTIGSGGTVSQGVLTLNGTTGISNPFSTPSEHTVITRVKTTDTSSTQQFINFMWTNGNILYYTPSTDTLSQYNGSIYKPGMYNLNDGNMHVVTSVGTSTSRKTYIDNDLIINTSSTATYGSSLNYILARYDNTLGWRGDVDYIVVYNKSLSQYEINTIAVGFSGIQLNGEGYTGGTLTLSPTTEVEYVATDGIARTVYGSAEYTDNVTVLDETNDGYYYSVNLSHQAGSNVTSGTITYDTGRPSLTGMEFSSTNPSATYTTEGSLLIISTGALTSEDTYTYSLALPTYSVSGHVTCDEELNGMEGATVTLNGFSATTNATGYYVFPSVTNGTYTVTASKTGYDPASRQITVSGQDVTVDDLCIHFVTAEQGRVRNTISLFMAIGAILGAGLMIGAGMVFYTSINGKSGVSFKQMKEIGYGAIFLIIFLLAVVMMGAAVYR